MESVFDILGPIMVGPSSSHTAGAVNIGRIARQVFGQKPQTVIISLYGSFAATYKGHGTDRALVAGILGFLPHDLEVKRALDIAQAEGIKVDFESKKESSYHPNTARIRLSGGGLASEIVGVSVGGGSVLIKEIDGFMVDVTGSYNTILCSYPDQVGMVAKVSQILAAENINIAFMKVSRNGRRSTALMVVEVDEEINKIVLNTIAAFPGMLSVRYIDRLS